MPKAWWGPSPLQGLGVSLQKEDATGQPLAVEAAGGPLSVSPCRCELTLCVWAEDTAVAWGC